MPITLTTDSLADFLAIARTISATSEVTTKLDQLIAAVNQNQSKLITQGVSEMALIDDLEAKVTQVQGTEASMAALLATIHDELVAANVQNPRVQAVIDMLGTGQDRMLAAIAAAPDPAAPPGP